ncbi:MAG: hypothetical protein ACP5MG_12030 [Verrucomicrobiia bacterium]
MDQSPKGNEDICSKTDCGTSQSVSEMDQSPKGNEDFTPLTIIGDGETCPKWTNRRKAMKTIQHRISDKILLSVRNGPIAERRSKYTYRFNR